MYKISQFSKITGLTIKALRYYDQEQVLTPSYRKEDTQYRYYSDEDVKKAEFIKTLRSLSFTMMELKEILETVECEADVNVILQEKIKSIKQNISKEKELIQKLQTKVTSSTVALPVNHYPIDIISVEEMLVAYLPFTDSYDALNHYIPILYRGVKNHKNGALFSCYFHEEFVEIPHVELCIPVKQAITTTQISTKTLTSIHALHTTHYGSYESLNFAYKALFTYVNQHHMQIKLPIREQYVKGPGMIFRGNPATYVTEIFLPFEV